MSNAEIVNAWFRETIATGPIARDTPAFNQAFAAKAELIARLDAAVPAPQAEPAAAPAKPVPQPKPAAKAASEE